MTKQHTTTRRAVLAGAASLPALAIIPATALAAGGVDPIFAAIEEHKAADAAFRDESVSEEIMAERGEEADQVLADLLATRPTTISGCVAVLRHVDHHIAKYEDEATSLFGNSIDPLCSAGAAFLATIAAALDKAAQS